MKAQGLWRNEFQKLITISWKNVDCIHLVQHYDKHQVLLNTEINFMGQ
jgi:hypothetical protein